MKAITINYTSTTMSRFKRGRLISFLAVSIFLLNVRLLAQVGISESSITPDPTAILELRSTTKGLLLPRLTTTNRDLLTTLGMTLYNSTTNSIDFYSGSWISLAPLASPTFTGTVGIPTPFNIGGVSMTSTAAKLNFLTSAAGTTGTTSTNLVFSTSPTLTTPNIGVATATSLNKVAITAPATSATLTIADGKTLTASNTLSLTGTDGSSIAFGAGGTATYTSNNLSVFSSTTSAQLGGVLSDETGSGSAVFANAPTLTGTTLAAGTATVDPLTFSSGTNLTTAAAGAVEYDGTAFYATSVASTRQVVRTEQFISNTANFTMANVATAQSVFAAANDVFTLAGTTTYFFEGVYNITGMGGTTRTTATLFGGTATITSIAYFALIQTGVANALGTAQSTKNCVTAAANILNATVTTAAATISVKGIVRINAGGTFIPQVQFSADPTGAILGTTNSWFRIYPVGTNTTAAIGNVN